MRRELAAQVGDWRPSRAIHRTPMVDWLLRAWRAGATLVTGDQIRILKLNVHYQQRDGPAYTWGSEEQHWCIDRLTRDGAEGLLRIVRRDLSRAADLGWPVLYWTTDAQGDRRFRRLRERLVTDATAEVFLETGWDAFDVACELVEQPLGAKVSRLLRLRTGEVAVSPPPFSDLAADAAAQLGRLGK